MRTLPTLDDSPFISFWEVTRACDLVCQHCRACALPARDPRELTTSQGKRLLDRVHAMGCPVVVLTGGDPAKREDLNDLIRHGRSLGLHMALTPSATPLVTPSFLQGVLDAGLARLAISLDGARPATHDGFRGVDGAFSRTLEILTEARMLGLPTQVNTSVAPGNVDELGDIARLVGAYGAVLWGVFFVVPTGRGRTEHTFGPDQVETLLERIADIAATAPFDVKTTAAPHYRRVLLQRKQKRAGILGISDGIGRAPRGVNDGQGVLFVSHLGDVYPSGFLPIPCGNVKLEDVGRIYRDNPIMRALREPDRFEGKCGACEFRKVCGGSRARAYATDGDPLGSDPSCSYIPRGWEEAS